MIRAKRQVYGYEPADSVEIGSVVWRVRQRYRIHHLRDGKPQAEALQAACAEVAAGIRDEMTALELQLMEIGSLLR